MPSRFFLKRIKAFPFGEGGFFLVQNGTRKKTEEVTADRICRSAEGNTDFAAHLPPPLGAPSLKGRA